MIKLNGNTEKFPAALLLKTLSYFIFFVLCYKRKKTFFPIDVQLRINTHENWISSNLCKNILPCVFPHNFSFPIFIRVDITVNINTKNVLHGTLEIIDLS